MKFAVNRYDINFHVILKDPAPVPGAQLERHPFGLPPVEIRPIWMVELASLEDVLDLTDKLGVSIHLSRSFFWSGSDLADPGERLYGFSLVDDPNWEIDPRDLPVRIRRESDSDR